MAGPEALDEALQVLEGVEEFIKTTHFLENFLEKEVAAYAASSAAASPSAPPLPAVGVDAALAQAALQGTLPPPTQEDMQQHASAGGHPPGECEEGFVVVDKEDAIEGMAYFIAVYLSRMPEAKKMDARQLQAALQGAMKQLHKSKFRMVLDYGRYLYRWSAIGYSAVQLYENPWVIRAVAVAVWASGKLAWGALGLLWTGL